MFVGGCFAFGSGIKAALLWSCGVFSSLGVVCFFAFILP